MNANESIAESKDIGVMLKLLNDNLQRKANEDLRTDGLTLSQMRVMVFIKEQETLQTTQKELEDYLDVSHPTINGLLKRLEAKGLVTTALSTNRRLTKIVQLTERGKQECERANAHRIKHEMLLRSCLSEEERHTLITLLQKVYDSLLSGISDTVSA